MCPYLWFNHEGAIKYFKEKGLWTEEHENWNENYLEELEKVSEAWKTFKERAKEEKIEDKEIHDAWIKVLKEVLGKEFPENYDK